MRPFSYSRADSVQAAISAQAPSELPSEAATVHAPNQFVAGGTTLTDLMKLDVMRPGNIIDINALERTPSGEIEFGPRGLHLGALVRMSAGAEHADVRANYPVIAQSLELAASQQNAQHGIARRQRAAADTLSVFPGHIVRGMQQARARVGLRRVGRVQSIACRSRHQRSLHRDLRSFHAALACARGRTKVVRSADQ